MKKRTGRALTGRNAARARIARDALLQMRLGKLDAATGTYGQMDENVVKGKSTTVLCDLLTKDSPCTACAKGALFLGFATSRRLPLGQFKVRHHDGRHYRIGGFGQIDFDPLRKIFGKNFDLVEEYFEGTSSFATEPGRMSANTFFNRHAEDADRLRVILRSICRNGKFVPPRVGA